ncbi:tripartite tricarboxylate transporter TctB family protein [Halomonas alkalicola]|uniref:tripartite tricarboxylate transporter TctB family protein n=1 Tax=Halomonas alkalicola TaxID=1930622 RepID=UPI002660479C|nr:tripartite tricarboxylate transporter TctB family protein [Halomonas alkalicola]
MNVLTSKDFLAGLVCVLLGGLVLVVSSDYNFGTPRRMGPGFFPITLGALLVLLGCAILLTAIRIGERLPALNLRPWLVIPAAVLAFALMLPRFGFAPAGIAVVILAGMADRGAKVMTLALLAAVLVPAVWALFALVLGVPLPFVTWS